MPTVADIVRELESLAPPDLAEDWDNVGLLVGDRSGDVTRLMACLTITPGVVGEAIEHGADLVVTHHPLPFRALKRLTTDTVEGGMLWRLAGAGVAVYSAHTAFDSAADGVNQQLAEGLGLAGITPFAPSDRDDGAGVGRFGALGEGVTLDVLAAEVKRFLGVDAIRVVGSPDGPLRRLGVACGSGGSLFDAAVAAGCDAILTGEASFHDCLKCQSLGVALLLAGHYASERFAVERLATRLGAALEDVACWASRVESDPLRPA